MIFSTPHNQVMLSVLSLFIGLSTGYIGLITLKLRGGVEVSEPVGEGRKTLIIRNIELRIQQSNVCGGFVNLGV